MSEPGKRENSRTVPTVLAAAMALLASTSGVNATGSQQTTVPPVATAKRQNEDDSTPTLVLAPPSLTDTLIADHMSHTSHSSHYSSSSDSTPDTPPAPAPPPSPPPTYTPPAPAPTPPAVTPPTATILDQPVLDKLALLPDLWPKKVMLTKAFTFTTIADGVATGHLDAPAGTIVDLIAVKGSDLVVSLLDNKAVVPASITDIGDRVNVSTIVAAPYPTTTNAAPIAPVPPASSPATPPQ